MDSSWLMVREETEVCGLEGFSGGWYLLMKEDLLVEGEKRNGVCEEVAAREEGNEGK